MSGLSPDRQRTDRKQVVDRMSETHERCKEQTKEQLTCQGTLQSAPTPPAGSQHSCQPTVKLHILPLVWIFLWERFSTGAQGAAAGIYLACASKGGHKFHIHQVEESNTTTKKKEKEKK